ncbi:Endonuclease/exonuclease/phosphatase [Podospora didyma]|uniref:Endonuclease/exonuclease/phosphatase n=1 Tax=Podospora didyma TaxID=330526 RepID=A0AAE0N454_9PEZI|nr:Endonuclease/exonuclease/phosphatase [Podospora didyma]
MSALMDASSPPSGHMVVRLVTLNIRYATKTPVPGEEPWSVRSPKLCAQLSFLTAGLSSVFVCLQEVLYSQLIDIEAHLGPSWKHIGRGREDGDKNGEFSPIFFRADFWDCEREQTFWLSPTPEIPSRGWDAALKRIVTVGSFRHKNTGAVVTVMSTHLDHRGETAREESARLLLRIAKNWTEDSSLVFLGGDFNSTPNGSAYKALTLQGSGMKDVSELVPDGLRYGNQEITYTTFGEPNEKPKRIDFLFAQRPLRLKCLSFGILENRFDDNVYLSDHRPVVADLEIPLEAGRVC